MDRKAVAGDGSSKGCSDGRKTGALGRTPGKIAGGAKAETGEGKGGQEDGVIRVLKPASVLLLPRVAQEPTSLPMQPA